MKRGNYSKELKSKVALYQKVGKLCPFGKRARNNRPRSIVRITGGAPFQATVYELQCAFGKSA